MEPIEADVWVNLGFILCNLAGFSLASSGLVVAGLGLQDLWNHYWRDGFIGIILALILSLMSVICFGITGVIG